MFIGEVLLSTYIYIYIDFLKEHVQHFIPKIKEDDLVQDSSFKNPRADSAKECQAVGGKEEHTARSAVQCSNRLR